LVDGQQRLDGHARRPHSQHYLEHFADLEFVMACLWLGAFGILGAAGGGKKF
jgi:hypothetical protein